MTNGFQYIIDVKFGGNSALAKAVQITSQLDGNINKITVDVSKASSGMNAFGNKGKNAFDSLSRGASGLIARLGVVAGAYKSLGNAAKQEGFDSAIQFASGNAVETARNLEFFRKTVDTLGAPLAASQEGFKSLMGSIQGTNITMDQGRNLFQGMASASTVMKLGAEQSELSLKALSQIASKGEVSMEELRGQLGDHLPGALNIAARAMGVTQSKLQDMVKDGISAEVFLPRFAAELQKTFGASALQQTNSATSNFNRMNTALYDLSVNIGQNLLPTAISLINNFLIPGATWVGKNINTIGLLATTVGGAVLAYKAWTIGLTAWSVAVAVARVGTALFTGGIAGMNVALAANPLGLVIAGLAGLTAGVIYAWNNFEGFRGVLTGSFYGALELVKTGIYALAIPMRWLSKLLVSALTGDWKSFTDTIKNDAEGMIASVNKVGTSYKAGYGLGVGDKNMKSVKAAVPNLLQQSVVKAFPNLNRSMLGLVTPGAVGIAFTNKPQSGLPAIGSTDLGKKAKDKAEGITGNGPGKNVTINIAKFFDQITIQTIKAGEGADQLAEMVIKKLVQAVNTANQVQ
jgi:tape measure domain-containing protein